MWPPNGIMALYKFSNLYYYYYYYYQTLHALLFSGYKHYHSHMIQTVLYQLRCLS